MKLHYPHARLAVYNQLLLGRSCAEAILAAAQECGLKLATEPIVPTRKGAETSCEALVTAHKIFTEIKPGSPRDYPARLATLLDQYKAENQPLVRSATPVTSLITCNASNCVGLAPVILDLILQSLDEVGSSMPNRSIIPMDESLPLPEHSQVNNRPAD